MVSEPIKAYGIDHALPWGSETNGKVREPFKVNRTDNAQLEDKEWTRA